MSFILVFRPHQRPAWAATYNEEDDFVSSWQRGAFASSCHAPCTVEDEELIVGKTPSEQYAIAFERVGHDLSSLTRLDDSDEVERYLTERDYCGHHNKGYAAVEAEARDLGWIDDGDPNEEEDDQ